MPEWLGFVAVVGIIVMVLLMTGCEFRPFWVTIPITTTADQRS